MILLSWSRVRGAGVWLALLAFQGTDGAQFEATGLVEPIWEAILAPTVLGRVETITVEKADSVAGGAVLMTLEKSFEELDADRRRIIAENTVELELAEAKLEVLQAEFAGTKRIYESSGSISKEEFERTRLDLHLAEAELAQLKQREKIEALEWQLAREQVSRREIRAPQSGTVVDIFPEVGEVCEPRQPLIRMVDSSTVKITLEVDALKTGQIAAGIEVPVSIEAPGGEIETNGLVDFISPVVDGASGLRRIQVSIANSDGKILPGLPATVAF